MWVPEVGFKISSVVIVKKYHQEVCISFQVVGAKEATQTRTQLTSTYEPLKLRIMLMASQTGTGFIMKVLQIHLTITLR